MECIVRPAVTGDEAQTTAEHKDSQTHLTTADKTPTVQTARAKGAPSSASIVFTDPPLLLCTHMADHFTLESASISQVVRRLQSNITACSSATAEMYNREMSTGRFTGWWYAPRTYTLFREMSSDEEDPTSPVLPKDSDAGSSVSSELQDEYEELLRYAVVTPKLDRLTSAHLQRLGTSHLSAEGRPSRRKDDTKSQGPAAEEMAGRSFSRASVLSNTPSDRLQTVSERSRPNSPHIFESTVTDMFISEENISKMGNILDTWSNNLKTNVLTELRKWKMAFMEQHKLEMRKERERCAAQTTGLRSELDSLKGLLHTYETSNQRKDEVIGNLSQVLDRQKEKLEQMRAFTHWRLQHAAAKEEAHAAQVAQQHYNLQLKKKVWLGWQSLIQKHWKVKVEQACRARAEEVCTRLSTEYEAKLAEHCEATERAQAEIQRLRLERERYEESMKKAFMRGVCALNMEALACSTLQRDGRSTIQFIISMIICLPRMSLALLPWLKFNHIPSLPHSSAQSTLTAQTLPTVK
ncbi:hypothetical protein FQN60_017794 [Etheostoma spectabile]|uniref:Centrosomal protein POC5 n=1 Tax=Etheostoma spectabile TaxID=54343 RepID=A0A5J5DGD0_9PERO|nr:hypothetical protein FQN60_017794 [Etheostoma spectabile]